ncbi:hypothetical protein VTK26DRAFT_941 [Humicola hyalothermophila]
MRDIEISPHWLKRKISPTQILTFLHHPTFVGLMHRNVVHLEPLPRQILEHHGEFAVHRLGRHMGWPGSIKSCDTKEVKNPIDGRLCRIHDRLRGLLELVPDAAEEVGDGVDDGFDAGPDRLQEAHDLVQPCLADVGGGEASVGRQLQDRGLGLRRSFIDDLIGFLFCRGISLVNHLLPASLSGVVPFRAATLFEKSCNWHGCRSRTQRSAGSARQNAICDS